MTLVVAMLIVVNSLVDAASPAPFPDSGSRKIVSPTLDSGSPFAPGALAHRHDDKDSDSDSGAKPDLRTVDWNKAKDGATTKTAANGNGDKNEDEDAEEEKEEEEKESEGFDRLWDFVTLG